MGKKSRRDRAAYGSQMGPRRGPTPERPPVLDSDDQARLEKIRQTSLAEAQTELETALAAMSKSRRAGTINDWVKDNRVQEALLCLTSLIAYESDEPLYLKQYTECKLPFCAEPEDLVKVVMRFRRYRKYWPRLRRRACWGCGKQYDLSEPRLWVCGGCDEARYCDEACQRAHWPKHEGPCWQKIDAIMRKRMAEGASKAELRREYFARGGVPMGN